MNARNKLNGIFALGVLTAASVIGLVFGSWYLFFLVLIVLGWLCLANGEIRFPVGHE